MSQGKATFATRFSHKCLVATREGESHFYESKGVIVILLLHSNLANLLGTKAIAITPHFVRYAIPTGRTISNKVWVVIAIIHPEGHARA